MTLDPEVARALGMAEPVRIADEPGDRPATEEEAAPTWPDGYCAPRFQAVRDRFAELLASGAETGASVCVMVGGETVVDLWGGWADAARTTAWQRDTIAMTYSVTKMPAALSLLWALDRHGVKLDDPVARVWPEYGCHGKEDTTIRHVLAHQAGLPGFPRELPAASWGDWTQLTGLLAAARPAWVPGTEHAEHAYTYGHLVGEIARRIDGRAPGRIWREELAQPLGVDFAIGLAPAEEARAAELEHASPDWAAEVGGVAGSFRDRAVSSPEGGRDLAVVNSAMFRRAEIPAINGHGTAAAIAGLYSALAGHGDGLPLSKRLCAALMTPELTGHDRLLDREVTWGLGVQFEDSYVGMGGLGGSDGLLHTDLDYSFGYVTRHLDDHDRSIALTDVVEGILQAG